MISAFFFSQSGRTSTYSESARSKKKKKGGVGVGGQRISEGENKRETCVGPTLIIMLVFVCNHLPLGRMTGRLSFRDIGHPSLDQQVRLPFDGVPQVYDQALVFSLIITDQIF